MRKNHIEIMLDRTLSRGNSEFYFIMLDGKTVGECVAKHEVADFIRDLLNGSLDNILKDMMAGKELVAPLRRCIFFALEWQILTLCSHIEPHNVV